MWFGVGGRAGRWLRWLALAAEIAAYLYWLMVDDTVASRGPNPAGLWQPLAGAVVAILVLARPVVGPARTAVAALAVSGALTITSIVMSVFVAHPSPPLSFTEQLALAVVTIAALAVAPTVRRVCLLAAGAGVVIVGSAALRPDQYLPGSPDGASVAFAALSGLGWIGAVAIGLALRENRSRRVAQLADARSAERMDLARELHDVVAHHVTGIVVAAQAATVVARTRPDEVVPALESIERAGADALGAMRQIVGVLRGQDAARTPGPDLSGVDEMVRRFDSDRGVARLRTDPDVARVTLPAGVAATGYRIVQEALTNVRRHAPRATSVEVELRRTDRHLLVEVRNDGVETRPTTVLDRGGFGLAGMTERVFALGGDLSAGPAAPGTWTVSARLPIGAGT